MPIHSTVRECKDCGQRYSPIIRSGGKLPRGYTVCPKCGSHNTVWVATGKKLSLKS